MKRTWRKRDSWNDARESLEKEGAGKLESRDVAHSGCCKGYAIAALLDLILSQLVYHFGVDDGGGGDLSSFSFSSSPSFFSSSSLPASCKSSSSVESGATKTSKKHVSLRLKLDAHVRMMRAQLADALTTEVFELLKSKGNTNRSGYNQAINLTDAKIRVCYDTRKRSCVRVCVFFYNSFVYYFLFF